MLLRQAEATAALHDLSCSAAEQQHDDTSERAFHESNAWMDQYRQAVVKRCVSSPCSASCVTP